MRIIVEYFPDTSEIARAFIKHTITASMVSYDESSSQYPIDYCIEKLEEANKKEVFNEDIKLLKELMEDGVTYIEI